MRVGFIGLGNMGSAIAANLLRAGHALSVWNRSPAAAQQLVARGAALAASAADAAHGEVLMSMLADDAAHRAVLLEGKVLASAQRGLIFVNLATISVALARELHAAAQERGVEYVAAPVFGRPEAAAAAKLNVVVAGAPAALERLGPLFGAISEHVWPMGPEPARANAVKLAGNFMIASALETMGEATALAEAYGVAPGEFLKVLTSTLFAAPVFQNYGRLIAERRYTPAGFKLPLGLKDVRLALQAAEEAHVPLPFASVLRDHFLEAIATGHADEDWAAVAELTARHAGLRKESRDTH
jgi:3-hydroxyisobutyrate dehydrogenase-like beta-hydroxyacid dehydrogenase